MRASVSLLVEVEVKVVVVKVVEVNVMEVKIVEVEVVEEQVEGLRQKWVGQQGQD